MRYKQMIMVILMLAGFALHGPYIGAETIGDYTFPNITSVDGYPVYQIGDVAIYRISPRFTSADTLQEGNLNPLVEIVPKRSYEIESSYIGVMQESVPYTDSVEIALNESIKLIDGNRDTGIHFYGMPTREVDPDQIWCRVDLPCQTEVNKVQLIGSDPVYFPVDFEIQTSEDALHWTTVARRSGYELDEESKMAEIDFDPIDAKMIRLRCKRLGRLNPHVGCQLQLRELSVFTTDGENLGLLSCGATAMVSSGRHLRDMHKDYWPLTYDLGFKWLRVGLGNDGWPAFEPQKGVYKVNPVMKRYYKEAKDYGVEPIYCICGVPTFYKPEGFDPPAPWYSFPETEEEIDAAARFTDYICRELKDIVDHWEILNEYFVQMHYPNSPGEMAPPVPQHQIDTYVKLVKRLSPLIKDIDPGNKVYFQGTASMCFDGVEDCLKQGLAHHLDFISWHPYFWIAPELYKRDHVPWAADKPNLKTYMELVNAGKKAFEQYGFEGGYSANEAWWQASYPWPQNEAVWPYENQTEIQKAKYSLRTMALHTALETQFMFCKTFFHVFFVDAGLVKASLPTPKGPLMQTQAAYYAIRTMNTLLDGAEPIDMDFEVYCPKGKSINAFGFEALEGQKLLCIWQAIDGGDKYTGVSADITLNADVQNGIAIEDSLNGISQTAQIEKGNHGVTRVPGVYIPDYPIFLRID